MDTLQSLMRWLGREPVNPGRELAKIGAEKRRRTVRETARQMRDELGMAPSPALER